MFKFALQFASVVRRVRGGGAGSLRDLPDPWDRDQIILGIAAIASCLRDCFENLSTNSKKIFSSFFLQNALLYIWGFIHVYDNITYYIYSIIFKYNTILHSFLDSSLGSIGTFCLPLIATILSLQ